MQFPLSFWDLNLWLAFTATILLITTELISPFYGKTNIIIERKKLRNVAIIISILFLSTIAVHIYETMITT